MRSGQTDDVFGVNRSSVLHRHDDAWFSEFIIFTSHLNLYTLYKALRCLYPQRLRKDIGWKLCKKSKYLQLWQCKHLPSNGLRTEKCSFSHDYTEGAGIIAEFHYDNPPLPRLMHIEKGFEQQVREPPIKFKVNKKDWLSEKIKYTPYTHWHAIFIISTLIFIQKKTFTVAISPIFQLSLRH